MWEGRSLGEREHESVYIQERRPRSPHSVAGGVGWARPDVTTGADSELLYYWIPLDTITLLCKGCV